MTGQTPPKDDGPRINEAITNANVLLIDSEGEKRGVMKLEDALDLAAEAGMDLVEVSPNADTPVCKVLDYGKYKYQAQKKANEARKKASSMGRLARLAKKELEAGESEFEKGAFTKAQTHFNTAAALYRMSSEGSKGDRKSTRLNSSH